MLSRIETAAPKVVRGGGREDSYRCASSTPRRRGSQVQSRRYRAIAAFDKIFAAPPGSYPFHANAEPRRIKRVRELRDSHEWFELADRLHRRSNTRRCLTDALSCYQAGKMPRASSIGLLGDMRSSPHRRKVRGWQQCSGAFGRCIRVIMKEIKHLTGPSLRGQESNWLTQPRDP